MAIPLEDARGTAADRDAGGGERIGGGGDIEGRGGGMIEVCTL